MWLFFYVKLAYFSKRVLRFFSKSQNLYWKMEGAHMEFDGFNQQQQQMQQQPRTQQQVSRFSQVLTAIQEEMKKHEDPEKVELEDDDFVLPLKVSKDLVRNQRDYNRTHKQKLQKMVNKHRTLLSKMKDQYTILQKGWFREKQY